MIFLIILVRYICTLGVAFLLIYVIGTPVGLYLIFRQHIDKVKTIIELSGMSDNGIPNWTENTHLANVMTRKNNPLGLFYLNFSFFFLGYRSDTYYWELVVLGRKALISAIGVCLHSDQRAQV